MNGTDNQNPEQKQTLPGLTELERDLSLLLDILPALSGAVVRVIEAGGRVALETAKALTELAKQEGVNLEVGGIKVELLPKRTARTAK